MILSGALASVYGKEDGGADTAVWLAGSKEGLGRSLIAHETIETLRKIGLLDDILITKEGLVVYPAEIEADVWSGHGPGSPAPPALPDCTRTVSPTAG